MSTTLHQTSKLPSIPRHLTSYSPCQQRTASPRSWSATCASTSRTASLAHPSLRSSSAPWRPSSWTSSTWASRSEPSSRPRWGCLRLRFVGFDLAVVSVCCLFSIFYRGSILHLSTYLCFFLGPKWFRFVFCTKNIIFIIIRHTYTFCALVAQIFLHHVLKVLSTQTAKQIYQFLPQHQNLNHSLTHPFSCR